MSAAASVAYQPEINDDDMRLTPAAQAKMAELLGQAEGEASAIRVFVAGGGCGGMAYGMTYADETTPYDSVIEGSGYKVVIDAVALNYLRGCEIDFTNDTLNPSFVFNNVFESVGGTGTCGGCGGGGCGS